VQQGERVNKEVRKTYDARRQETLTGAEATRDESRTKIRRRACVWGECAGCVCVMGWDGVDEVKTIFQTQRGITG